MRGVTIERTLSAYGKVMKTLPKEKRYLVDMERNSFNFVALYLLMEELRSESVQLHIQIPRAVHSLYFLAQRNQIATNLEWNDTMVPVKSNNNSSNNNNMTSNTCINMWSTSITIDGKIYSTTGCYPSKSIARDVLAVELLEKFDKQILRQMYKKQSKVQDTLAELRRSVVKEECEQLNSLTELISDSKKADSIQKDVLKELLEFSAQYRDLSLTITNDELRNINATNNKYTSNNMNDRSMKSVNSKTNTNTINSTTSKNNIMTTNNTIILKIINKSNIKFYFK